MENDQKEIQLDELITAYRKDLQYDKSDEDLIKAVENAIKDSQELKQMNDKRSDKSNSYWASGTDVDMSGWHKSKSKMKNNRIFADVETAIPILTSEPPEPTLIGDLTNEQREQLEKGLEIAYDIKYNLQLKLQEMVRGWMLNYIGVWKYRWDKECGFNTEVILAKKIGFDKKALYDKENAEYFWEELECKVDDLIEKFPKKKQDILNLVGKDNGKSKVKYYEFWGGNGEWVCWKYQNIILDKIKNPNYLYGDEEDQNVFDEPQFPYILLNVFNTGNKTGLYDETSLVEQCIPLQDGVNKLEQQIIDLNEGQKRVWVCDASQVSEKEIQDLVNKTGDLAVRGTNNSVGQVQSGKPDASLFNNLSHLLGEIDNIIGIHSTTRGERVNQETLGGRKLLMGSDYGRLDLIVRNVERVMEEWYNAYLQMIKVYSLENEVLKDGKGGTVEISKDMIPQGIQVMVKKGSTLPIDKRTKREQALELVKAGMIDPITLFEELGYPNVEQRVKDLYAWLQATGKIQLPQQQEQQTPPEVGAAQGQLQRIQTIINSPQFKALPKEEQQQYLAQAREIVQSLKQ